MVGKVVTREWWNVQSAKLEFAFVSVLEIIQVLDFLSWVRCASGNVCNSFWYNGTPSQLNLINCSLQSARTYLVINQ